MIGNTFLVGMLSFATTTLLIMNNNVEFGFFKFLKNSCSFGFGAGFSILFYTSCQSISNMNYYIISMIVIGIVSLIIFLYSIMGDNEKMSSFRLTIIRVSASIFLFAIAILLYAILHKLIGIPHTISDIIVVIPYSFFVFAVAYL